MCRLVPRRVALFVLALASIGDGSACKSSHDDAADEADARRTRPTDAEIGVRTCKSAEAPAAVPSLAVFQADDAQRVEQLAIDGTVQRLGDGYLLPPGIPSVPDGSRTQWFRVQSADRSGREWVVVGSDLPFGFGVEIDSPVKLTWRRSHATRDYALILWSGGQLAFYAGAAPSSSELRLPPAVVASQGAAICHRANAGGEAVLHALEVTIDGTKQSVGIDEQQEFGERYVVWQPGVIESVPDWPPECFDCVSGVISLAIGRLDESAPQPDASASDPLDVDGGT